MFEELFPDTPFKLHVYTGTGEIEEVEYDGGEAALTEMKDDELLKFVSLDLKAATEE